MEKGDLTKKPKMFTVFLDKIGGTNPASFQGVCINDFPIVEDLVQMNIFLYDVDFVDGAMIGESARGSVAKHCNTVGLLHKSHLLCIEYQCSF